MNILCISRSPCFSPHSEERDTAIMEAVGAALRHGGHEVTLLCEDSFSPSLSPPADALCIMARDTHRLRQLAASYPQTRWIGNAPRAVLHATRTALTRAMHRLHIAQPRYEEIHQSCRLSLPFPLWLKRGDATAQTKGDVVFIADEKALSLAWDDFASRGVEEVLAFSHEKGDLVKFYGVSGADFFFTTYPTEEPYSKFGCEVHNSPLTHTPFSRTQLQEAAERLATEMGIFVYGGDAIIRPDGSFSLIDFNDFPSFSPCRTAAAEAIASLI